jgi:hypothetical protein
MKKFGWIRHDRRNKVPTSPFKAWSAGRVTDFIGSYAKNETEFAQTGEAKIPDCLP